MFRDRHEAGQRLALELAKLTLQDPVVLALPRGGVPVAAEVAKATRKQRGSPFARHVEPRE